jgi:hypothetical protein
VRSSTNSLAHSSGDKEKIMTSKQEQIEAQKELRKILRGVSEIRTMAEWTGSTAYVRLFIIRNNQILDITHKAGVAMGEKTAHAVNKPYGLKYGGYGYGKEFTAVYDLGRTLYPKGYKHTTKECHSNDHVNHGDGDNLFHRDGGYKFNQRTI